MARNDGIDRTVARNQDLGNPADVAKVGASDGYLGPQ